MPGPTIPCPIFITGRGSPPRRSGPIPCHFQPKTHATSITANSTLPCAVATSTPARQPSPGEPSGAHRRKAALLGELQAAGGAAELCFGRVDGDTAMIWSCCGETDPNQGNVEINVRRTVFYPAKPRINFLAVRGFIVRHAATPWAPPTAEQPRLIGTYWSKGWIIEDNTVCYSRSAGITLGKYGNEYDKHTGWYGGLYRHAEARFGQWLEPRNCRQPYCRRKYRLPLRTGQYHWQPRGCLQ